MEKKRITLHNQKGRKGKGFSASHNDRTNTSAADHIIEEKSANNQYWTHDGESDFMRSEMRFYEKNFRASLDAKNLRYLAARHDERCQSMWDYYRNEKTAPDETLLYVGKKGDTIDSEKLWNLAMEYKNWIEETYPNYRPLTLAIHVDEQGAPHIHFRAVFFGHDKDNNLIVGMEKALREMGIERPVLSRKEGRYNNRKMAFTAACRAKFQALAEAAGVEIETQAQEKSKTGMSMTTYQAKQEEQKAAAAREQREDDERRIMAIEKRIESAIAQETVMDNEKQRLKHIQCRAKKEKEGLFGSGDEVIKLSQSDFDELKRMAEATAKAEMLAKRETEARKDSETEAKRKLDEANAQIRDLKRQIKEEHDAVKRNNQAWSDYSAAMAVWEYAPSDIRAQLLSEAETRAAASDEINRLAARAGKQFAKAKATKIMRKALDYIGISRVAQGEYIMACVRASERKGATQGGRAVGGWHNEPKQTDYSVSPSALPQWLIEEVAPLIVPPTNDNEYAGVPWEWLSESAKDEIKQKRIYRENY